MELQRTLGIGYTAIMSWSGPVCSDPVISNDFAADAARMYPDHFGALCYIDPLHLSEAEMTAEIERCHATSLFIGLKPYIFARIRYGDARYRPAWKLAERYGWYVLLHTAPETGGVLEVAKLAEDYPEVTWIIAHVGGSFAMARETVAAMRDHTNIYGELTLTPVTNGVIEYLVGEIGDDRILFGTDSPMRDPRPQFGWVVWSDIPVTSRRRILGENFHHLRNRRTRSGREDR